MFSQTLGTALGDWTADTEGLGYGGGIVVFGTLLAVIAAGVLLDQGFAHDAFLGRRSF